MGDYTWGGAFDELADENFALRERAEAAEARVKELEGLLAKSLAYTLTVKADRGALIADVEDWMSDALIELPHDAVELNRILDKHRGQP